jgi:hypothetical protein
VIVCPIFDERVMKVLRNNFEIASTKMWSGKENVNL